MSATVVIDPGHGGSDHGAKSRIFKRKGRILEKDLTLKLAKKIKKHLSKRYTTYLTRSLDRDVSLDQRAQLAEKVKADLFVSIHINANEKRGASGFETYYLDNHTDKAVKKIEEVENKNVDGSQAVVNQILAELVITSTAPASKKLSNIIHRNLNKRVKRKFRIKDRGVKPGLFYVLALTKIPAVLLEAGFITNNKDLKMLKSDKFQEKYAKAVADSIHQYLKKYHKKEVPLF